MYSDDPDGQAVLSMKASVDTWISSHNGRAPVERKRGRRKPAVRRGKNGGNVSAL